MAPGVVLQKSRRSFGRRLFCLALGLPPLPLLLLRANGPSIALAALVTDQVLTTSNGLLDQGAAAEAFALARPSIETALRREGVSGERVLHVVVMNPQARPAETPFEEAVLFEASLGDPATWGADYRGFARSKAELSWRLGCDTHLVQEFRPHLLRPGDTLLWGGVCRDGLVVACSGAHPWFDEAFANLVAGFLLAIAQERARGARERGLTLSG